MSKGNLFLGFGRGSVGDVVFSRQNGEQVARARNRSPRNPKTTPQLFQRVLIKTTAQAYSFFQDICNHAYQGYAEGTESQSRFMKLNLGILRQRFALEIAAGDWESIAESGETNFASKNTVGGEFNSYVVSEGKLPTINVSFSGSGTLGFMFWGPLSGGSWSDQPTYQQVVNYLGLQRGDQLTFLFASIDDTADTGMFNGFDYARVILEPADGNMSGPFVNASGAIQQPNPSNRGSVYIQTYETGTPPLPQLIATPLGMDIAAGKTRSLAACAVIVSRLVGGVWSRSTQSLVLRPNVTTQAGALQADHAVDFMGDAISSYMADESSTLYLNQAR